MKYRSTLLYIAIALLIGGYIYIFERKPLPTEADKKGKVLPGFVADDIVSIRLEALSATVTAEKVPMALEKDDQGVWSITAPKRYKGDETHIRSVLTVAGDMAPETTLTEPGDLAGYGLAPPAHRVSFSPKEGKTRLLEVGSKDIQGTAYYLRSDGSKEVFLVTTSSVETILKKIDDYRDHNFFKPDPILAKKVRLTKGNKTLVLDKDKEGAWRIASPLKAKASESKVRALLNAVSSLRLTAFVKDDPAALGTYGLSPPAGSLEVWLEEKGPPKAILVGSKKEGTGDVFAKQGDLPYVVQVPEYFKTSHIDFKLEDYRDKDAMKFDAGAAKTLTLHREGKTLAFQADDQGQWTTPGRAGPQGEAADLLTALSQTAILEFADDASSPSSSSFLVEAALGDGTKRTFRFGAKKKDRVLLASDLSRENYWVSAEVLDKLENCFKGPSPAAVPTAATPAK